MNKVSRILWILKTTVIQFTGDNRKTLGNSILVNLLYGDRSPLTN